MFLVIAIGLAFLVFPETWRFPVIAVGAALEIGETAISFWLSRRASIRVGPETLIGATAVVATACRPKGQVRVRGEVWRARCDTGADPGQRVVVAAREGLTLVVELQTSGLGKPQ